MRAGARERVTEVVVVHDSRCPACSGVGSDLAGVLRYPVLVRSCHEPGLVDVYPSLRGEPDVLSCRAPAVGIARADGSIRWWTGPRAVLGALPTVHPARIGTAIGVLRRALGARRARSG
ncbi:MAG: hypothetical protein JWR88_203 [Pseudonocardia sp.]|nr:hypothetical protein [Pseudonocardia sp.]